MLATVLVGRALGIVALRAVDRGVPGTVLADAVWTVVAG
jgi:hypothetical protein